MPRKSTPPPAPPRSRRAARVISDMPETPVVKKAPTKKVIAKKVATKKVAPKAKEVVMEQPVVAAPAPKKRAVKKTPLRKKSVATAVPAESEDDFFALPPAAEKSRSAARAVRSVKRSTPTSVVYAAGRITRISAEESLPLLMPTEPTFMVRPNRSRMAITVAAFALMVTALAGLATFAPSRADEYPSAEPAPIAVEAPAPAETMPEVQAEPGKYHVIGKVTEVNENGFTILNLSTANVRTTLKEYTVTFDGAANIFHQAAVPQADGTLAYKVERGDRAAIQAGHFVTLSTNDDLKKSEVLTANTVNYSETNPLGEEGE